MNISDLEFFLVEPRRPLGVSPTPSLVVRLATASGQVGWGEARCRWRAGELADRRGALLPAIVNRGVFDVEELLALDALADAPLRCAVEMACWDAIGRYTKLPLCRLWGGEYRTRVPLAVRLPQLDDARTAQLARELAEHGFHAHIVTSSGQIQEDVRLLRAIRAAVGKRSALRLDAAGRYARDEARELCDDLESLDLEFLLDPLSGGNFEDLAALTRMTTVPTAVSRGVRSPSDLLALARLSTAPQVVIDLNRVGGTLSARKCTVVAEAADLRVSLGGGGGLGIALAARLHLAAALPSLASSQECAYHQLHESILDERPVIADGMIQVPQNPGLGVEVDRSLLEGYAVS